MGQRIVIELRTDEEAESLARALGPLLGEVVTEGAHVVLMGDRTGDRFVVDVLDVVKAWLDAGDVESVQVLLDGRTYTLAGTSSSEITA